MKIKGRLDTKLKEDKWVSNATVKIKELSSIIDVEMEAVTKRRACRIT